jgi:hypothetical protein
MIAPPPPAILAAVCEGRLRKRGRFRPGRSGMAEVHPTEPFAERAGKVSLGAWAGVAVD